MNGDTILCLKIKTLCSVNIDIYKLLRPYKIESIGSRPTSAHLSKYLDQYIVEIGRENQQLVS